MYNKKNILWIIQLGHIYYFEFKTAEVISLSYDQFRRIILILLR